MTTTGGMHTLQDSNNSTAAGSTTPLVVSGLDEVIVASIEQTQNHNSSNHKIMFDSTVAQQHMSVHFGLDRSSHYNSWIHKADHNSEQ